MDAVTFRLARTFWAGARAAGLAIATLAVVAVIAIPLGRAALDWYTHGQVEPLPPATAAKLPDLRIMGATAAEEAAVKRAAAQMRYPVDPRAVTFIVTDQVISGPGSTGEYIPLLQVIRLQRSTVDDDGMALTWTVAHEVGHYVDQSRMDDAARQHFEQLRGIPPSTNWFSTDRPWDARPSEDFAEVFAAVSLPWLPHSPSTRWGPVRHQSAYEHILRAQGVVLHKQVPAMDWRESASREIAFARELAVEPRYGTMLGGLFALYLIVAAAPAMARSWNASAPGLPPVVHSH